ncbi:uncharacterized protein [Apostichopus japonicus]|uniref:uncharacterized protein isoform X2 n=1 Tax=Stichopus japonicus TaxID=307972 RepID=UPI003AB158AD
MMESTLKKQRLEMNLQQTNSSYQTVEPSVTHVNSLGHVRSSRYNQPRRREIATSNVQSEATTPALSEVNMADHTEGGSSSFIESVQPDYQCTDESATAIIHPSIPLATEVSELMNTTNWQATLDPDVHISDKWDDLLGEPDTCDASQEWFLIHI